MPLHTRIHADEPSYGNWLFHTSSMSRRKSVPDPVIISLAARENSSAILLHSPVAKTESPSQQNLRMERVKEFLLARSLATKSQKAYQQDLQYFLRWTELDWVDVTTQHITRFKSYLLRRDPMTNQRVFSDATVRRMLGTLKNFYGWMERSGYITTNPTAQTNLPKLPETPVKSLTDEEVGAIYQAASKSNLPERNVALISVLLHGLKTEEVSSLMVQDYYAGQLNVRGGTVGQLNKVALNQPGKDHLDAYLTWRQLQGERLTPDSPLFISHSRRNSGKLLGYDGIRKIMASISAKTNIDFCTYQFRHTFVESLIAQGIGSSHVMALTRHTSLQSLRRYTTPVPFDASAAIEE